MNNLEVTIYNLNQTKRVITKKVESSNIENFLFNFFRRSRNTFDKLEINSNGFRSELADYIKTTFGEIANIEIK